MLLCILIFGIRGLSLFQVAKLKQDHPIPFDIYVAQDTRVLVITGPNTGGKTICLKTIGLAAMMAKSGKLYLYFSNMLNKISFCISYIFMATRNHSLSEAVNDDLLTVYS